MEGGRVVVTERPEVRESGGVVPTPREVVDEIMDRTVHPLIYGRSPTDLAGFTVLDMCCGSGIFLLSAFERLCDHYLDWYITDGVAHHAGKTLMEDENGWRLTFWSDGDLLEHIRGVDIDPEAVEVARLSLLLKLVEGESRADLQSYVTESGIHALPDLSPIVRSGNSLVSHLIGSTHAARSDRHSKPRSSRSTGPTNFRLRPVAAASTSSSEIRRTSEFRTWRSTPPRRWRSTTRTLSPYSTGAQDNFDKYALFVERGIELLIVADGHGKG